MRLQEYVLHQVVDLAVVAQQPQRHARHVRRIATKHLVEVARIDLARHVAPPGPASRPRAAARGESRRWRVERTWRGLALSVARATKMWSRERRQSQTSQGRSLQAIQRPVKPGSLISGVKPQCFRSITESGGGSFVAQLQMQDRSFWRCSNDRVLGAARCRSTQPMASPKSKVGHSSLGQRRRAR